MSRGSHDRMRSLLYAAWALQSAEGDALARLVHLARRAGAGAERERILRQVETRLRAATRGVE